MRVRHNEELFFKPAGRGSQLYEGARLGIPNPGWVVDYCEHKPPLQSVFADKLFSPWTAAGDHDMYVFLETNNKKKMFEVYFFYLIIFGEIKLGLGFFTGEKQK